VSGVGAPLTNSPGASRLDGRGRAAHGRRQSPHPSSRFNTGRPARTGGGRRPSTEPRFEIGGDRTGPARDSRSTSRQRLPDVPRPSPFGQPRAPAATPRLGGSRRAAKPGRGQSPPAPGDGPQTIRQQQQRIRPAGCRAAEPVHRRAPADEESALTLAALGQCQRRPASSGAPSSTNLAVRAAHRQPGRTRSSAGLPATKGEGVARGRGRPAPRRPKRGLLRATTSTTSPSGRSTRRVAGHGPDRRGGRPSTGRSAGSARSAAAVGVRRRPWTSRAIRARGSARRWAPPKAATSRSTAVVGRGVPRSWYARGPPPLNVVPLTTSSSPSASASPPEPDAPS